MKNLYNRLVDEIYENELSDGLALELLEIYRSKASTLDAIIAHGLEQDYIDQIKSDFNDFVLEMINSISDPTKLLYFMKLHKPQ